MADIYEQICLSLIKHIADDHYNQPMQTGGQGGRCVSRWTVLMREMKKRRVQQKEKIHSINQQSKF